MFVQLFVLFLNCLVIIVRTEDACDRWKYHTNFHLLPGQDECGKVNINQDTSSGTLNGQDAGRGSLPWMAFIVISPSPGSSQSVMCGGAVINEKYILTAAHCYDDSSNPTTTVTLGLISKTLLNDGVSGQYKVAQHFIHHSYDKITLKNDIALLRLDRSINFTTYYVNYICLPSTCDLAKQSFLGKHLLAAGWGSISNQHTEKTFQKVELEVKRCEDFKLNGTPVSPDRSRFCAGTNNALACLGNSGGPLVYEAETDGRFVQVGVTSSGPENCTYTPDDNAFTGFTRVASFMGWILKTMRP